MAYDPNRKKKEDAVDPIGSTPAIPDLSTTATMFPNDVPSAKDSGVVSTDTLQATKQDGAWRITEKPVSPYSLQAKQIAARGADRYNPAVPTPSMGAFPQVGSTTNPVPRSRFGLPVAGVAPEQPEINAGVANGSLRMDAGGRGLYSADRLNPDGTIIREQIPGMNTQELTDHLSSLVEEYKKTGNPQTGDMVARLMKNTFMNLEASRGRTIKENLNPNYIYSDSFGWMPYLGANKHTTQIESGTSGLIEATKLGLGEYGGQAGKEEEYKLRAEMIKSGIGTNPETGVFDPNDFNAKFNAVMGRTNQAVGIDRNNPPTNQPPRGQNLETRQAHINDVVHPYDSAGKPMQMDDATYKSHLSMARASKAFGDTNQLPDGALKAGYRRVYMPSEKREVLMRWTPEGVPDYATMKPLPTNAEVSDMLSGKGVPKDIKEGIIAYMGVVGEYGGDAKKLNLLTQGSQGTGMWLKDSSGKLINVDIDNVVDGVDWLDMATPFGRERRMVRKERQIKERGY